MATGISHFAKDCRKRQKCNICKRWHPSVLHREWKYKSALQTDSKKNTDAGSNFPHEESEVKDTVKCDLTNSANHSTSAESLPGVVPVILRSRRTGKQTKTCALLDSGSNAVFCPDAVVNRLKEKGKAINIQVQTLTDENVVKGHVLRDLEIMDLQTHKVINLPEVYTQAQIQWTSSPMMT